jgi:hypothetical protein
MLTINERQKRYYLKRQSEGWKTFSGIMPPEILEQVKKYKNALMANYRNNNNNENTTTTDTEEIATP